MAVNDSEKDSNKKLLIVGLIIVLLSINGILFYMQHQKKQKVEEQEEIIRVKNTELENQIKIYEALKADFERQQAELQELGVSNDSLATQLEAINRDLGELRAFRNRSFSLADQRRFRDRSNALEQQLKEKDAQIAQLREDNELLFSENTELKTSQNRLNDSLRTARTTNRELSEKVALASKLQAQDIMVSIINSRGKEKEDDDEEYRARRVDKIKVSFKLAKNDVAPKEQKEIMMRLIEPDGAAVYNLSTGGGMFEHEGNEMFYTAKRDLVFDNSGQEVSFVYDKGTDYKKGKHTVELYSGGYQIGTTSFVLK